MASRAGSLPSLPSCNCARPWHRKSRDKTQQGCWEKESSPHGKSNVYPQNAPAAGQDASLKRSCCPAVGFGACVWQGKGFLLLPPCAEQETEPREGAAVCSKVKQESEQVSHSSKRLSTYPVCPVHSQFLQQSLAPTTDPTTHCWACSDPRFVQRHGDAATALGGARAGDGLAPWANVAALPTGSQSSSRLGRWSEEELGGVTPHPCGVAEQCVCLGGQKHISGRIKPGKGDDESCPCCKFCPKKGLFHQLAGVVGNSRVSAAARLGTEFQFEGPNALPALPNVTNAVLSWSQSLIACASPTGF